MKLRNFGFFCVIALVILFAIPYLKTIDTDPNGWHLSLYEVIVVNLIIFSPAILPALVLSIIAIWIIRKHKKS